MVNRRLSASGALLAALGMAAAVLGFSVGGGRAQAALNEVSVVEFSFQPSAITIPQGDQVRWVNDGSVPHTITSNTGLFNQTLGVDGQFTYQFGQPGTFIYHCEFHPQMVGSVTVTGPTATATQFNTPTSTNTATPTSPGQPAPTNTPSTPTAFPTSTFTATLTLTATNTHTPTAVTPATNTSTPISPIPDATQTPIPSATIPATSVPATATKAAPLPPNTGSGNGDSGAAMLFLLAGLLIVSGTGLGAAAVIRRR